MTDVALRTGPADLTAITDGQIDTLVRLATNLAASGMFKDAKRGEEAFAKLVFGRDLGLGATQALTEVHIVDGKPELSANLQASMLKVYVGPEGERYDFRKPEHTNDRCVLIFRKRERGGQWENLGDSTFTIEDAKTAGLVRQGSPWTKYPRNMLFARAMSNGVAWYCPEVTGGVRVFSPGEIGGPVTTENVQLEDEPAEVVDAEVVEHSETITAARATALVDDARVVGLKGADLHAWAAGAGVSLADMPSRGAAVKALRVLTPGQADGLAAWIQSAADRPDVAA